VTDDARGIFGAPGTKRATDEKNDDASRAPVGKASLDLELRYKCVSRLRGRLAFRGVISCVVTARRRRARARVRHMLDSGDFVEGSVSASAAIASRPVRIMPVFQPIVDLLTGAPLGYEVLARTETSKDSAEHLFAEARRQNTTWELEQTCRRAALERISELGRAYRNALFFLNVSPAVLEDPRFTDDFNTLELRRRGIEPASLVLEVTEKQSISQHERFSEIVRHYTSQGLRRRLRFGSFELARARELRAAVHQARRRSRA